MAPAELRGTLNLIRDTIAPPGDAELLARHLAAPGGPAFAELVRRHGPMVYAVCLRMLGNEPDARDAFQETFLRFLRQARSVRRTELLAGWLYRVAANECRRLRARQVIRAAYEESAAQSRPPRADGAGEPERRELLRILDEEVERLPEPLRTALVLCDLQGLAQEEAARRVGWPRSTLAFRLERARGLLRDRLRRRGYESPADVAAVPALALPRPLLESTLTRAAGAEVVSAWRPGRALVALTAGVVLVGVGFLVGSSSSPAPGTTVGVVALAPPPASDPKPDQTQKAIERGVAFLRQQEAEKGHWETGGANMVAVMAQGGFSCPALLALMDAGVPPDDPVIQRGLAWQRQQQFAQTYVVGLQTAVYARAELAEDKPRIQKNVDWLLRARARPGGQLRGWSYTERPNGQADNSNSQYAILGLDAARQAGAKIDPEAWSEIRVMYLAGQQAVGGWGYDPHRAVATLTMTEAGTNGLLLAGLALSRGRTDLRPDDSAALQRGLKFVGKQFTVRPRAHAFYNLFGISRLGRNSGLRFFGEHDWYREGREFLLREQHPDGSWWVNGQLTDGWPVASTSFALLFLAEGRRPILVRKFAHGSGDDWNGTRYDARHLADYASAALFDGKPMGWQYHVTRGDKPLNGEELAAEVRDLRRSPVLYLPIVWPPLKPGEKPAVPLTAAQKQVLRRYVEDGGFAVVALGHLGGEDVKPVADEFFPPGRSAETPGRPPDLEQARGGPGRPLRVVRDRAERPARGRVRAGRASRGWPALAVGGG